MSSTEPPNSESEEVLKWNLYADHLVKISAISVINREACEESDAAWKDYEARYKKAQEIKAIADKLDEEAEVLWEDWVNTLMS